MTGTSSLLGNVQDVLARHLESPDFQAVQAVLATVASHRLSGKPCWIMAIAPPGSGKTVLVEPLEGLPEVHLHDKFTSKTLISGQIPDPLRPSKVSPSLLHRWGPSAIVTLSDFSTMLAGHHVEREEIFAALRRIYDGHYVKSFGTSDDPKKHEWTGKLTLVGCSTPRFDEYASEVQSLGERFLLVRWQQPNDVEAALRAIKQDQDALTRELKDAVHGLFGSIPPSVEPVLLTATGITIANLAALVAKGRAAVSRESYTKAIKDEPQPESPTRLAQQLAKLARGASLLDGRTTVSDEDYKLVKRVAFDCLPRRRRLILDALIAGRPLTDVDLPGSTRSYAMDDLEAVGLLRGGRLSDEALERLDGAGYVVAAPDVKPPRRFRGA
jgi:hypothetical protein